MTSKSTPFVGRQQELAAFHHLLTDDTGCAVVIVGQQGMGKTTLANELVFRAEAHFNQCFCLRYSIIQQDTADAIMERMLEEAFAGAEVEGSFSTSPKRQSQWAALLKVLPKGKEILGLFQALKQQPGRPVRERLLAALQQVSAKLKANQRLLFVIDPDEYMQPGSAGAWAALVHDLPERILLIFPQRPGDELAQHGKFMKLENVVRLPADELEHLEAGAVEVLVDRTEGLPFAREETLAAVGRYKGHPYAVAAALDLLVKKQSTPADLPSDPAGVAAEQWKRVCQQQSEGWVRAFKAYTVLEVAVPAEVACAVAEITPEALQLLRADAFVGNLLGVEPSGARIYHSLLSDHIGSELSAAEQKAYHERARDAWRQRLENSEPKDILAAQRLPEHVLVVDGPAAFAKVVAGRSAPALLQLGFLEENLALLQRARGWAEAGSKVELVVVNLIGSTCFTRGDLSQAEKQYQEMLEFAGEGKLEAQATAFGNLGLIYWTRGDLGLAEQVHQKALKVNQQLGNLKGVASQYGHLGLIHGTRGDLEEAEQLCQQALQIHEQLKNREGIAIQYTNLGVIHRIRGDLDLAEQMHLQALEIHKQVGGCRDMASSYGSLGLNCLARGDLDAAEQMLQQALELHKQLGRRQDMATDYSGLGLTYRRRGNLMLAEQMHRQALQINQQLGSLHGMATDCANLGSVSKYRGDLDAARKFWERALELFEQLGSHPNVEQAKASLASLDS